MPYKVDSSYTINTELVSYIIAIIKYGNAEIVSENINIKLKFTIDFSPAAHWITVYFAG